MRSRKLIAPLLLFLWLAALGCETLPEAAKRDQVFLWAVKSRRATVYLLGSLHLAPAEMFPLDPRIEKAFARADVLVIEADPAALDQPRVQALLREQGLYPPGQSLSGQLSPRTRAKAEALQISLAPYNRLRPWLAALTLQGEELRKLGYEPEYGLDLYFLDQARQAGKPVLTLETVEGQLRLLIELSKKDEDLYMYYALAELENLKEQVEGLVAAWKAGDAEAMEAFLEGQLEKHPEFKSLEREFIFGRNKGMLARLEEYLQDEQTYFVVVGAGHLVGQQGLLARLQGQGYEVSQL